MFSAHVANLPSEVTGLDFEESFRNSLTLMNKPLDASDDHSRVSVGSLGLQSLVEFNVVRDNETGESRGFGFAIFLSEDERMDFIERFNMLPLCGSPGLAITAAKEKPKPPKKKTDADVFEGSSGRQWLSKAPKSKSKGKHNPTKSTDATRTSRAGRL